MKAVVATFNQEKALVGAFSVITNLRMELFGALVVTGTGGQHGQDQLGPGLLYLLMVLIKSYLVSA